MELDLRVATVRADVEERTLMHRVGGLGLRDRGGGPSAQRPLERGHAGAEPRPPTIGPAGPLPREKTVLTRQHDLRATNGNRYPASKIQRDSIATVSSRRSPQSHTQHRPTMPSPY